ncbi:response regulator [Roseateles asaccharophilus]|uniref:CheY-like chemotaxis protein n=1 Tax=Roseateles asaccharophilus TaxID=582607 RepID=A0ABU2AEE4_9BURK|nr:response regulator [Roseateles asaccharophilus]MDR7334368.1 CheY-like chemotaxis protein [Roseateles asaccharophilus]
MAPSVLLVEDDSIMRRFVSMALGELPIQLVVVTTVEDALAILSQRSVALILTDLMLPGRSGMDLIDALAAEPRLRGDARLAVFSAGLDVATRRILERPDVWRLLSKPCSVAELEDCVTAALAGEPSPESGVTLKVHSEGDQDVIAEHFDGNAALYHAFRASCLEQFQLDLVAGRRAMAATDAPGLRRLAHNLKSILRTLGHRDASDCAAALENACEAHDWNIARPRWEALARQLESL